jgi:hypothetical protein
LNHVCNKDLVNLKKAGRKMLSGSEDFEPC